MTLMGLSVSPSLSAAPITFNTALPVAEEEFVFRAQGIALQSGDDPGLANRDLTVYNFITVLGYGVSPQLAVFGVIPYLDKNLNLTVDGARQQRNISGLGDAKLFGRYTAYKNDKRGQTFRVAPFVGFKAPTGDDDSSDALGLLPPPFQLGSGSWDLFGGVVLTYQTLGYQMDTQLAYSVNTEANGFEAGDEVRWDASLQYRLWPQTLSNKMEGFLYGILESNLIYRDNNQLSGVDDLNSGGLTWMLAPGIQYVSKRWIVETVIQVPVVQNLNGNALETDYIARASLRMNF